MIMQRWLRWFFRPAQWICTWIDMQQFTRLTIFADAQICGAVIVAHSRKILTLNTAPSTIQECVTLTCLVPGHQVVTGSIKSSTIESRWVCPVC
ncbi:hypothetical protein C1H21_11045 [Xanthomonas arboricola pv. juglandis]|nr:hypothetical protein C1H21_11045 [Xanthomonas arboricola pv. juglandis]